MAYQDKDELWAGKIGMKIYGNSIWQLQTWFTMLVTDGMKNKNKNQAKKTKCYRE